MTQIFIATAYSFYDHNGPLIFFGGMSLLSLVFALIRPSRANLILFVGFLLLTFSFEYDKHLISQVKSHWLDLVFPQDLRFTKYSVLKDFFERLLPIIFDVVGWSLIAVAIFVRPTSSKKDKN